MSRWSTLQEQVLWEHGNEGADRCAAIIRNLYGVSREPEAVRRHAYRIGAPMLRYEICPDCGRKVKSLTREGVCRVCHQRQLADRQRERNARLMREIARSDEAEYEAARREYDRLRQQFHRESRKA